MIIASELPTLVKYNYENPFDLNTDKNIPAKDQDLWVVKSPNGMLEASISLDKGGRLTHVSYMGKTIIADPEKSDYKKHYAGAILFPFANRIKNGKYFFGTKKYQLESNEENSSNAIHGLVYNKKFQLTKSFSNTNASVVKMIYEERNPPPGFPFKFIIQLTYTLTNTSFSLDVKIENTSSQKFPFTLGWHPYLVTSDIENCILKFDSQKQILFNHEQITIGTTKDPAPFPFPLKNKSLDDCFVLTNKKVGFKTPEYDIELDVGKYSKYLQLYTPADENRIAIEPMTGISDSFNNKKGVKVLKPDESYEEVWKIKFNN